VNNISKLKYCLASSGILLNIVASLSCTFRTLFSFSFISG